MRYDKENDLIEALYHINQLEKSVGRLYLKIDERLALKIALKKYKYAIKESLGVKVNETGSRG